MSAHERPRLRPYLAAAQDHNDPRYVFLWDRLGLADGPRRVTLREFTCIQLFDGRRTLRDIVAHAEGNSVSVELLSELVRRLDEGLFLEGSRFRERLAGPIREPSCIGCYEAEPVALRRQLEGLFTGPKGPGLPGKTKADGRQLRAALVPHIDYARGGPTFAWGFKEVFERTDASLFVIVGTSHYSPHRFTLTRKHFKTPLGVVPTDQEFIDRLVGHYGAGLFDDELAHLPEHSIELEVVLLQYLYAGRRPFRIVPLVVGSFHDCIASGTPADRPDVRRMVEALRRAEAEMAESICYLISGDLAHIGPKFNDPHPVDGPTLARSRAQDQAILKQSEAADPEKFFRVIADEGDSRRICGLPPTYTVLAAVRPGEGEVLHYDQHVHPRGHESVSFASVAFYR